MGNITCDHEWVEIEIGCEDCGDHSGLRCTKCDELVDLVYEIDPREEGRDDGGA